jgi:BTB/POZ domain-containing protein KCTD1/15
MKNKMCMFRRKCDTETREMMDKKASEPRDLSSTGRLFSSAQIKISSSPAISPTSNSSSPTPAGSGSPPDNQAGGCIHAKASSITGIPCVAAASKYTAPVHIDVGGTIYTSSLETLTK